MEIGVSQEMKKFLIALLIPFLTTCTYTHHHNKNTYNYTGEETAYNLPRDSFMFVSVKEESRICIFERCFKIGETAHYIGSGFVIKNTKNGSLVITAAHVCTSDPFSFYTTFELTDIDGKKYQAMLLHELVHYMQWMSGYRRTVNCINATEPMAYELEEKFRREIVYTVPWDASYVRTISKCY